MNGPLFYSALSSALSNVAGSDEAGRGFGHCRCSNSHSKRRYSGQEWLAMEIEMSQSGRHQANQYQKNKSHFRHRKKLINGKF